MLPRSAMQTKMNSPHGRGPERWSGWMVGKTRRRTFALQNASRGIGGEPGEDRRHAVSAVSASFRRCWRNCSYQPSLRWYASRKHVLITDRPPTSRLLLAQSCAISRSAPALSAAVRAKRASLYSCEIGAPGVAVGEEGLVSALTAVSATVASCSSCRITASCCLVRARALVVALAPGP